ncbi:MAG: undecaprenyl-diphosphate phosphatase [Erysipelotrichaceae bacterium]|nr:undecaprenyl-diphosphate phosphatase [Erysipelotrichaceae bacterium]
MEFLKAILFGIIEGITEWMPVSSTAHLMILNRILPLNVSEEFFDLFDVVIQLGAILALVIVFFNKIWPFGASSKPLGKGILKIIKKDKFFLWIKIMIACIPVIIYELLLEDRISFINADNEMRFIAIALIAVGLLFIVTEMLIKGREFKVTSTKQITYLQALIIGLAQLVAAVFPGVSRSGATIIAALLLGINRSTATEFTFEVAVPVMFGASLMKVLKFSGAVVFSDIIILLLGCVAAFIVSLFMIRFVLDYIKKNTFTIFGIYRIIIGIIILIFLA